MNGVALLVALSALGVDHTWRQTQDGQVEYVLQVEPVFLEALAEGKEITSQLPAGVERIDRLCIRIGSGNLEAMPKLAPPWPELNQPAERPAGEGAASDVPLSIYVAADGQPYESYDLTYGWQAADNKNTEYLVQIAPSFLRSLREGDELYTLVRLEAGPLRSFSISSGRKVLPRESAKPTVVAVAQVQSAGPRGSSAAADVPPTTDLTGDQGGSIYGQGGATQPAEDSGEIPAERVPPAGWNIGDVSGASAEPIDPEAAGQRTAPLQPPATQLLEAPQFDGSQFPAREPRSGISRTGSARAGMRPSSGQPASGSRYQDPPALAQPRENYPTGREPITAADYQQQDDQELRTASRSTTSQTAGTKPLPRRSAAAGSEGEEEGKKPEFPTLPFSMSLFALFLSLGANLYLGWTAAEFYSRYKLAVERLRSAGR